MLGARPHRLSTQGQQSVPVSATTVNCPESSEPRRFLHAIARIFETCEHEGPMTPLRTLKGGIELWRCERCGAEVLFADDSTWDGA